MLYTIAIGTCRPGMKIMIKHGTMRPYVTQGSDTSQIFVRGNDNLVHDYDRVKYCPFCGSGIRIIDR